MYNNEKFKKARQTWEKADKWQEIKDGNGVIGLVLTGLGLMATCVWYVYGVFLLLSNDTPVEGLRELTIYLLPILGFTVAPVGLLWLARKGFDTIIKKLRRKGDRLYQEYRQQNKALSNDFVIGIEKIVAIISTKNMTKESLTHAFGELKKETDEQFEKLNVTKDRSAIKWQLLDKYVKDAVEKLSREQRNQILNAYNNVFGR